ncbi:hypothetical protein D6779_02360 [Candidatus Parcubacteria bacterium]|nr:MAG: hypothetical protein D6779_02360 [Candidatus Parcubacteria bacterium]
MAHHLIIRRGLLLANSRQRHHLLVPLVLALFTFVYRLYLPAVIGDDAYITFRYAEHIARGVGFVYNEGERVLGTTTPLFTLILALFRFVFDISPEIASHWISAVSDAATVAVLCELGTRLSQDLRLGGFAGLLFSLSPLAIRFSINGMETAFAVALMLGALLCYLTHSDWAAGLLAGLAILTRPEAVLLALVIAVGVALTSPSRLVSFAVCLLIVIVPWLCFAYLYFGNPLPNSMVAKSAHIYQWSFHQTMAMLLSHFAFLFVGYPLSRLANTAWPGAVSGLGSLAGWLLTIIPASIQGYLIVIGIQRKIVRQQRAWMIVCFPALYLLSYMLSGIAHVLVFDWYLAPLQPFYLLLISSGLLSLTRGFFSRFSVPLLCTVLVLCQLAGLRWTAGWLGLPIDASADRESLYREIALQYATTFGRESLVAAPEIGALGYFSEARILDTAGLVSPIALSYYPIPQDAYAVNYSVPPELIRDTRPQFVVAMEVFISHGLLQAKWFRTEYREIDRRYTTAFSGTYLLVFQRVDLLPAAKSK